MTNESISAFSSLCPSSLETISRRHGIVSLSLRERVRVRGIAERYSHFASPHPGPLPEGEGVLR
jgi:hypothetical protein